MQAGGNSSSRVDFAGSGSLDVDYKGLEQALAPGKDQTAFDEEEQSEDE
jgi:hypothetical protein